jgi:hypothetical protein
MRKLKFITFLSLALLFTVPSFAEVRRVCKVKYETEDGWSKEYTVEVTFITGRELNKATKSYDYDTYSNYCLIWFDKGEVAILEIQDYLISVGEDFDAEDFRKAFRISSELDTKQVNSPSKRKWKVIGKDWTRFIDPRENK